MSKFKVGDKVRFIQDGCIGTVCGLDKEGGLYIKGWSDGTKKTNNWESDVELVSRRGRPAKPKKIKFVVIYDLVDRDPVKEFFTRKELMKWVKEAQEDNDIVWDSIKIYPVDKVMRPKASTKISLRKD